MDATDAKTQKIEPDPIFFDGRKFCKAVCKRDCQNRKEWGIRKNGKMHAKIVGTILWTMIAG